MSVHVAREIRNNNPLNIRYNQIDKWKGLLGKDDAGFCRFTNMQCGVRAAILLLRTYYHRGWRSTGDIIRHWCPDRTADTYVKVVCEEMSRTVRFIWEESSYPILPLYSDLNHLYYFLNAMAYVECGSRDIISTTMFDRAIYDIFVS